jgi:hypothetical protein
MRKNSEGIIVKISKKTEDRKLPDFGFSYVKEWLSYLTTNSLKLGK